MKRCLAWKSASLAFVLACVVAGRAAIAQSNDPLAAAETAYSQIEFEQVRDLAQRAIDRGGYRRAQLARSYFLLGVARAALGDDAQARDAFARMLELDPESRADRGLSPRLRGPLLEARGLVGSRSTRMAIDVQFDRRGGALLVSVEDPLSMARSIRARFRTTGVWSERTSPAAPTWRIEVPASANANVDCVVTLLDSAGNELASVGAEAQPRVFAAPIVGPARTVAASRPSLLAPAAVTLGVGAVVGGLAVTALVFRESNATRWNDDAQCLPATGASREETCRDARVGAESWQTVALASTIVGGAAVVTSVVLFALSPRGEASSPRVACAVIPTTAGAHASCSVASF
ncbi:MAG: tetratricopeptide repeat protein [Myxococcales bacterium]|nr:tetratricopeptide repeat protein [Myxococcales bacterium]